MSGDRLEGRILFFQSTELDLLSWVRRWVEDCNGWGAWAIHPPEGDKPEHYHLAACFDSPRDFRAVRTHCMRVDPHSSSQLGRSFRRCMRYLRHLDSPDKIQIPPEDLHAIGQWPPGQFDVIMSADRQLGEIVGYIREHARDGPIQIASDLLRDGYKPHQVTSVLRLISSVSVLLSQFSNPPNTTP